MRLHYSVFMVMVLVLAAGTASSAGADYVPSANSKHALTGRISQSELPANATVTNGMAGASNSVLNAGAFDKPPLSGQASQNQGQLSANKTPLTGRISQSLGRLFGTRAATTDATAAASKYASSINATDPATRKSYSGMVNVSQFSAQAQRTQLLGQAPRAQAPAQTQNAYANNRAVRQAEMEALGVGLNSAGLGAWHCPVCRLLKGF